MKQRDGFVSNSSSASFLIAKRDLKAGQIAMIKNPPKVYGEEKCDVYLSILENDVAITGSDSDAGMHWLHSWLIDTVKVDPKKITWGD